MTYLFPRSITLIFLQSFIYLQSICFVAEGTIMPTIQKYVTQNKRVLKVTQITKNSLSHNHVKKRNEGVFVCGSSLLCLRS